MNSTRTKPDMDAGSEPRYTGLWPVVRREWEPYRDIGHVERCKGMMRWVDSLADRLIVP
ncbi:hypothetical protein [Pedobacter agri]|uniref:hypothetical protein n=1 Tax=Pedobacter agri TaxID=454586 RepID=UPI00292FEF4B|nr:hypothetical protein [Pedobacter agri]